MIFLSQAILITKNKKRTQKYINFGFSLIKLKKGYLPKDMLLHIYSKDIHRVVSVSHQKAKLSNKIENLQKVPIASGMVNTASLQNAEKGAKTKR